MTGLNRSTVGDLVADLSARGLVAEGEAVARGGPGRPSPLVSPSGDGAVVLAVEITVDSLAAAVVGVGGEAIARVRVERCDQEPAAVVAVLRDLAEPLLAALDPRARLLGIGVSVAGLSRQSDGMVQFGPNLGWREVPLGELLEVAFGRGVPVLVGNDGDLGALAEHTRGVAVGTDDLVYLSGEVGVGAGVIAAGRPLTGVAGYAGEAGHMLVNPDGEPCHCGATGCWETETGETALLRRARGTADTGGRAAVAGVLESAAAGDDVALAAVRETARWLGRGIGGLVNILNPSMVVLGGLFAALHQQAASTIAEAVAGQGLAAATALVKIVPSALGVDSPLFGAAELAFRETLHDPARVPYVTAAT